MQNCLLCKSSIVIRTLVLKTCENDQLMQVLLPSREARYFPFKTLTMFYQFLTLLTVLHNNVNSFSPIFDPNPLRNCQRLKWMPPKSTIVGVTVAA